jgi:hypothetical protein
MTPMTPNAPAAMVGAASAARGPQSVPLAPRSRVANPTAQYARLLTRHAQARMQQRAVPIAVLASLLEYGAEINDRHGAVILYFDRESWAQLANERRQYVLKATRRYRNVYAVIGSDGRVATVGRRYRRIPRP